MNAPSLPWVICIGVMLAVFVVLVGMAVWRYLAETAPEDDTPPDPELDDEMIRRAIRAWQAFAESHVVGPCRECGTPDGECIPQVRWCCNRCAASRGHTHPIVDKRGGDQ